MPFDARLICATASVNNRFAISGEGMTRSSSPSAISFSTASRPRFQLKVCRLGMSWIL